MANDILRVIPLTPGAAPLAEDLKEIFWKMREAALAIPKDEDWYAEYLAQAIENHLRKNLDGWGNSLQNMISNVMAEHIREYHAIHDGDTE